MLFFGESGSGKTTIRSHLLSSLLALSSTPLSNKLSLATYVFDTLTTTKSSTTQTASKAGLFYELQYDASSANPTLIGGKLLDHRLERSRVTAVPTGERSFHILYYLLAGTSAAEKTHLGLHHADMSRPSGPALHRSASTAQKRWRYLGHPTQLKVGVNDTEGFQHFKTALRKLEFPRADIAEICQVLAAILHIGQLEFGIGQATATAAEESGGYSHEGGESVTMVKNTETLATVAAFLGLSAAELEESLRYKTKTIHRERVTVMLDPTGARESADELARTLYALLVAYIIEVMNQKLCAAEDSVANTVSIIDFPGFADQPSTGAVLDQLLSNTASESLYNICLQSIFEKPAEMLEREEVSVPATSFFDNSEAVRGLLKHGNGLLAILDDQTKRGRSDVQLLESLRKRFENKNKSITISSATSVMPGSNFATANLAASFTVRHYAGEVEYPVNGLVEANSDTVSGDLMNLMKTTKSDFVGNLFGQEALNTVTHAADKTAIVQAQVSSKPLRKPSMARRKHDQLTRLASRRADRSPEPHDTDSQAPETGLRRSKTSAGGLSQGAASQFLSSLDNINKSLTGHNMNNYFVFCLKPNDRRIANQFDSKCVRQQVQILGIAEISQRLRTADYSVFLPFGEFLGLADVDTGVVGSDAEKTQLVVDAKNWPSNEVKIGTTGVFLSERCWASIAVGGTQAAHFYGVDDDGVSIGTPGGNPFSDSKARLDSSGNTPGVGSYIYGDETKGGGYFGSKELDGKSDAGASAFHQGDMFRNMDTKEELAEKGNKKKMEEVDVVDTTGKRKRWLFLVYLLTWFIPDFSIKWLGRMPRKDVRVAWREKLAINMLIWFTCLFACFFIVVFPELICPRQDVYSAAELSSRNGDSNAAYVSIRGVVFDLGAFMPNHYPYIVPTKDLENYAGLDATGLFPVQVSALCQGKDGRIDPSIQLDYTSTNTTGSASVISSDDPNRRYHDFRAFTNDSRPDWFFEQMMMLKGNYQKGHVGYTPNYVKKLAKEQKSIAIIHDRIYDFTTYIQGGRTVRVKEGEDPPEDVDTNFMSDEVVALFQQRSGQDVSRYWDALTISAAERNRMQLCLDNLFFAGVTDTRNSPQCLFARYILLAISMLLVSVIGFKFFAALQFTRKTVPENLDKFVICQVPAYTEDEESLRRAIDSAARMKYDDKRKLLIIICDGMIIGQGNDRPTPRIVLDILGVSETVDPEPLSFESLGEGMKQHNMGKVYSGLYEVQGHIVPFMVVVKVGKPSEVSRPGNRGKRDSQMVVMRFLNRVHYNLPMSPLELEMHHQIRNIIGVNPTFYEFMLQIDADTVVAPDSATRMIASFLNDTRIIALCGETSLSNSKSSIITMIQVYEYYISHNLTKAFESLFGSVTCLPGCFTMYRIRAAETGKPLFVCKEICEEYAEIRVDTLHMKNLLHLGEDRYLTTLLLKHHPKFKTKYIFTAHAWTIAPESWTVFMSQRRRWINSTVHNLMELIPLQQLCGFCCFSMRFIVFLDLLSTIVAPVAVAYIVYLIVLVALDTSVVPLTAFLLLGAIYGLQAIIFILRRKWEMIGWMIIYILAMPVFSLGLPLYSFWHMDDFSWGNTRLVTGEKGKQILISDEGKFDPDSIPKKKWEEYQAELWDAQTQRDETRSELSGYSYGTKSYYPTGSVYGGTHDQQQLLAGSRTVSQLDMHQSMYGAPLYAQSRMSLAPSDMLGGMGSRSVADMEMSDLTGLPTDDMLLSEIREILRTVDLMTVTKKGVKQELERRFNCSLDAKRAYIGSGKCIDWSITVESTLIPRQPPKQSCQASYEWTEVTPLETSCVCIAIMMRWAFTARIYGGRASSYGQW